MDGASSSERRVPGAAHSSPSLGSMGCCPHPDHPRLRRSSRPRSHHQRWPPGELCSHSGLLPRPTGKALPRQPTLTSQASPPEKPSQHPTVRLLPDHLWLGGEHCGRSTAQHDICTQEFTGGALSTSTRHRCWPGLSWEESAVPGPGPHQRQQGLECGHGGRDVEGSTASQKGSPRAPLTATPFGAGQEAVGTPQGRPGDEQDTPYSGLKAVSPQTPVVKPWPQCGGAWTWAFGRQRG